MVLYSVTRYSYPTTDIVILYRALPETFRSREKLEYRTDLSPSMLPVNVSSVRRGTVRSIAGMEATSHSGIVIDTYVSRNSIIITTPRYSESRNIVCIISGVLYRQPSMASGSHVCNPICADLPIAAKSSKRPMIVKAFSFM
jgi:hypothetical protein